MKQDHEYSRSAMRSSHVVRAIPGPDGQYQPWLWPMKAGSYRASRRRQDGKLIPCRPFAGPQGRLP